MNHVWFLVLSVLASLHHLSHIINTRHVYVTIRVQYTWTFSASCLSPEREPLWWLRRKYLWVRLVSVQSTLYMQQRLSSFSSPLPGRLWLDSAYGIEVFLILQRCLEDRASYRRGSSAPPGRGDWFLGATCPRRWKRSWDWPMRSRWERRLCPGRKVGGVCRSHLGRLCPTIRG